jgi:hypothetical protein
LIPPAAAVPLELDWVAPAAELVLLLPLPPHAASANAVATPTTAATGRVYFLMRPPPRGLSAKSQVTGLADTRPVTM